MITRNLVRHWLVAGVTVLLVLIMGSSGATAQRPSRAGGPLPRIAITATGFVDIAAGVVFVPRGANHLRLTDSDGDGPGDTWYLSHFEPGLYDRVAVRDVLVKMRAEFATVVRIFVDEGRPLDSTLGVPHGMGRGVDDLNPINGSYMDNVADFYRAAIDARIHVIPVTYRFPQNCYYYRIVQGDGSCSTTPRTPNVEGRNAFTMDARYVAAKREYLKQFSAALLARIGPENATATLMYQAENESYMQTDRGPWSLTTGTITPSDGGTYDLAVPAQRQQAADASLVQYTIQAKAGLLEGDPNGKLTMGFFTHNAVGKPGPDGFSVHCGGPTPCDPSVDYRYPSRGLVAARYGALDAVDIHFYPRAAPYTVAADLASAEANLITTRPWFVGELGAVRRVYGDNVTLAGEAMRTARAQTCTVGRGARGVLGWPWDNQDNVDQKRLFPMSDTAVGDALSARLHPNLCTR